MLNTAAPGERSSPNAGRSVGMRATPPAALVAATLAMAAPAPARPPVVDVHVHTTPERYALVLDVLASNGVSRFVNLSGGAPDHGLDEAVAAAAPHDGRILVCANLEWRLIDRPDFVARQVKMLERARALGARCLKISKALGLGVPDPARNDDPDALLAPDDRRLDPIWAAAGRLGMPVFWHVGDPRAFFEPATPANERWAELRVHPNWSFADPRFPRREALLAARDRVLARHRGTVFVGVHFANNPEDPAYVDRLLRDHPNLYVDVAARLPEIGRHDPDEIRALFVRHQDRILFGTDLGVTGGIMLGSVGTVRPRLPDIDLFYADHYRFFETRDRRIPHPTPIQGDWRIDAIDLPESVRAKVYSGNALRLLWGLDGPTEVDRRALEEAPGPAELHAPW